MPQTRGMVTGAAIVTGAVLVTTALISALDPAASDPTSFFERRLPVVLDLGLFTVAAVAPFGILACSDAVLAALGLALATVGTSLPLWAAWPELDPRSRALALAAGPVALAGFALMARSWPGVVLASAAGLMHALAYDPFRDLGCARVCLHVSVRWDLSTERLALIVALAMTLAAAVVVAGMVQRPSLITLTAAAGAVMLAIAAVVRWRTVGDSHAYAVVLLGSAVVPGLVALPAVVLWTKELARRSAVRRLARDLAEDPEGLLALGRDVDPGLLSAGQQLAVRNAQLAAEAQERLAEVRASQRRVVAAADAERRRIERDLHDGTQQRLVGVLMQLSGHGLDDAEQQVRDVLADLRSFSRSMFPPVLEEEGLEVALAELAATSDAELRLDVRLRAPVASEHARAVYALVALADSGRVDVCVSASNGRLDVTVAGLGAADVSAVQDRFGALDGTLAANGETIVGSLPCES